MTAPAVTFAAMGGTTTVIVEGDPAALEVARRRIVDLESKWSRFRPDSEISRLNAARTTAQAVSADTSLLVRRAITAWTQTAGGFDPTVFDSMVGWGYDRDLPAIDRPSVPQQLAPAPGLGGVEVDEIAGTVHLGGAGFDPGGIAKGLAADLVATELVGSAADAALVNVAGDLRIAGHPPDDGWIVALEDPRDPDRDLLRVRLSGGGLATSSDRRRRWLTDEDTLAHHLLDPATGAPATTSLAGASVLAGEAWWAEALTKAVLVGGLAIDRLGDVSASGIGRTRTGAVVGTPDLLELSRYAA